MEKKFTLEFNGQQVQQADLNTLGETAGLADDRVFAELLRITPNTSGVTKAIIPYSHQTSGTYPLVQPSSTDGKCIVNPFRAIIGSRTDDGVDARKAWQDIRSVLSIAEGATALGTSLTIAANASGDARWDTVYATVVVDANYASVTRKVKDPTTKVVSGHSTSVFKVTTMTLAIQVGSTGPSPEPGPLPSDSGSTFYIPIAHIRVPAGFNATSRVATTDICIVASTAKLARALGANTVAPANQSSVLSSAQFQAWGASGTRPTTFLPGDTQGAQTLYIAVDLSDASAANHSHADLAILDDRDWSNRLCFWSVVIQPYTQKFPWDQTLSPTATAIAFQGNQENFADVNTSERHDGAGQTFIQNNNAGVTNTSVVVNINGDAAYMDDGAFLQILCDLSGGSNHGKLKLKKSATNPRCVAFFKLEFSAPFHAS